MARRVGPADWLVVADRDLSVIRLCLVKAVLVAQGTDVPKTHDIDRLVALVPAALSVRKRLVPLARFTAFAAAYRYPGEAMDLSDDPTAEDLACWLAEIETARAAVGRFLAP